MGSKVEFVIYQDDKNIYTTYSLYTGSDRKFEFAALVREDNFNSLRRIQFKIAASSPVGVMLEF